MYKLLKPILFLFSPEKAHAIVMGLLKVLSYIPGANAILRLFYTCKTPELEREVFGIHFKNPIGLAAGMDKNGEYYNQMTFFSCLMN